MLNSIDKEIDKLWDLNRMFDEVGEIAGYKRKIKKMMSEYDDLTFWLSQNSNESILDIEKMSHGKRVGFQTRLIKHIEDKAKRNQGSREHDE